MCLDVITGEDPNSEQQNPDVLKVYPNSRILY